jgi:hypothetical protein
MARELPENHMEASARRSSESLKWLEKALMEWRNGGFYGELGIVFSFHEGNVVSGSQVHNRKVK